MSYIGRTTNKSSDIRRFNATSSTSATHTLTWTAPNEQSLLVTINGVKQQEDAYSVSGTTLTLTSALVSTDKLEVIGINDIGTVITPAQNSVDTDKIQDDAVTADKLANSINTEIAANTAKVTNATHTGDVTGDTALTIAADAVDIAMLSATGTASSSTFLRGDNAWAAAGGDNTPTFLATSTTQQTVTNDVTTKIELANSIIDTDSAFDNTTNYRFTVPAGEGGKYFFQIQMYAWNSNNSGMKVAVIQLRVNGSSVQEWSHDMRNNFGGGIGFGMPCLLDLSAADYLEIWGMIQATGTCKWYSWPAGPSSFGGFKLL